MFGVKLMTAPGLQKHEQIIDQVVQRRESQNLPRANNMGSVKFIAGLGA